MFESFQTSPDPIRSRVTPVDMPPEESYLGARWFFLRALGLIFFSAFFSLWSQALALLGSRGLLPVAEYFEVLKRVSGARALWEAPSLLWLTASDPAIMALVGVGTIASVTLLVNLAPRLSIAVAGICFLSIAAVAQDFSAYQSDGMLLEAAFLALFFAPRGWLPHLGEDDPPTRISLILLRWEWFRIHFESGLLKILSGEPQWRNFTAMDKYYENSPLPTWIAWYVQHMPHGFHAFTAFATLAIELFVVCLIFFPGRWPRLTALAISTLLQLGIIATGNYAFLNYLVLALGLLLIDDDTMRIKLPEFEPRQSKPRWIAAGVLSVHFLIGAVMFFYPRFPPARLLAPLRIVNNYGLFAVMTRARYEIEFEGTLDGENWIAYPFRYKPQEVTDRPRIFAPYHPRFDWNLWFASLGTYVENSWVLNTQARLLEGSPQVLELFRANPFPDKPPIAVRATLWQYRFSTRAEKDISGAWWVREVREQYSPVGTRDESGHISFGQ